MINRIKKHHKWFKKQNDKGFSLLEIVAAVGVVLVLVLAALTSFNGAMANSRNGAVQAAAETVYNKVMSYESDNSSDTDPLAVEEEYNTDNDNIKVKVEELGSGRFKVVATYQNDVSVEAIRITPVGANGVPSDNNGSESTLPNDDSTIISPSAVRSVFNIRCEDGAKFTQLPLDNVIVSAKVKVINTDDENIEPEEFQIGKAFTPEEYEQRRAEAVKELEDNYNTLLTFYSEETLKSLLEEITGKEYKEKISFNVYLDALNTVHETDIKSAGYSSYIDYFVNTNQPVEKTNNISPTIVDGTNYQIIVDGKFKNIKGDKSCLQGIETIGTQSGVKRIETLGKTIKTVPENIPNSVTELYQTFMSAAEFNDSSVSNWDTSNVLTMYHMFSGAKNFNQSLSKWDTSKAVNMEGMFKGAVSFNQDISDWNVNNVQTMKQMFYQASAYNNGGKALDWTNMQSLTTTESMFKTNDTKLYPMSFNQSISSWNTPSLNRAFSMFENNQVFNNGKQKGESGTLSWNMGQPKDISNMFKYSSSFNQTLKNWDTSKVTNMNGVFFAAIHFNNGEDLGESNKPLVWDTSNVETMAGMFYTSQSFNQPLVFSSTSKVKNMSSMFGYALSFNQDIGDWDTSSATNISYMFEHAQVFNQNLNNWDTSNVTNMSGVFSARYSNGGVIISGVGQISPTYSVDFNNGAPRGATTGKLTWDTSNVTRMTAMFRENASFNQDIGDWDVRKVSNMDYMFSRAKQFNQDLTRWKVPLIKSEPYDFTNQSGRVYPYSPQWGVA